MSPRWPAISTRRSLTLSEIVVTLPSALSKRLSIWLSRNQSMASIAPPRPTTPHFASWTSRLTSNLKIEVTPPSPPSPDERAPFRTTRSPCSLYRPVSMYVCWRSGPVPPSTTVNRRSALGTLFVLAIQGGNSLPICKIGQIFCPRAQLRKRSDDSRDVDCFDFRRLRIRPDLDEVHLRHCAEHKSALNMVCIEGRLTEAIGCHRYIGCGNFDGPDIYWF